MVRDEHDLDREVTPEEEAQVKLDMKYIRNHNQVTITVMHAKNLVSVQERERRGMEEGIGRGEGSGMGSEMK